MLDTIQHRGPDDRGVYLDESVGLGHQRLSIIDIEGGHQPMATEDGQIQVVYNGELYNFRELRKDLERNYRFRTRSDTEVILAAYATWGSACFTQFNGIFALAIWDGRKRQLLLVRDGVGVKPLYYYLGRSQAGVCFGDQGDSDGSQIFRGRSIRMRSMLT